VGASERRDNSQLVNLNLAHVTMLVTQPQEEGAKFFGKGPSRENWQTQPYSRNCKRPQPGPLDDTTPKVEGVNVLWARANPELEQLYINDASIFYARTIILVA